MNFLCRPPMRVLVTGLFIGLLFLPVAIPFRVMALAGLAMAWTMLEARSLAPLGIARQPFGTTLIWGVGLFALLTAVGQVTQPLIEALLGMKADYRGYGALAGNASTALKLFAFALVSAAVGEEILFRGFLLHQFSSWWGDGVAARWSGILLAGLVCGLGHHIQGPLGVLNTTIAGVIFGWA